MAARSMQLTRTANESGANQVANGATFNGASIDTAIDKTVGFDGSSYSIWSKVRAEVFADQAGTVFVQHSRDGITWRTITTSSVVASTGLIIEGTIGRRFVRVNFTNTAGSSTTVFELDSTLVAI